MKKKIIILLCCFTTIFFIYKITYNPKVDYLALGDGLALGWTYYNSPGYGYSDYISEYLKENKKLKTYSKNFAEKELSIKEMINKITKNETTIKDGKTININQAITDAELITISIGNHEISDILKYMNDVNESQIRTDVLFDNLSDLIDVIKKYNKESNIYIIGFYCYDQANKKIIDYTNKKFIKLAKEKEVEFIKISDIFENNIKYLPNAIDNYPTNLGYKEIAKKVLNKLII